MAEFRIGIEDYKFFCKISSMYDALCISALDPVVVRQDALKPRVLWDESENDDWSKDVVRDRITRNDREIAEFVKFHIGMNNSFLNILEYLKLGDRQKVLTVAENINDRMEKYAEFVERHVDRLGEDAFINYPRLANGHRFVIPEVIAPNNKIKKYNKMGDYDGVIAEVEEFDYHSDSFYKNDDEIFPFKLYEPREREQEKDNSLTGKLNKTRELLVMAAC